MNAIALLCVAAAAVSGATVTGKVANTAGEPIPQAQVFLEKGISGSVLATQTQSDGAYRFENVPTGLANIIAIADGYAFSGGTCTVRSAEEEAAVPIRLAASAVISGTVVNAAGEPVSGARIDRVLILGESKASAPYEKLREYGFSPAITDDKGQFTVERMPEGARLAVKIVHPLYAQEVLTDITPGTTNLRVAMDAGFILQGRVLARKGNEPIANVQVLITNNTPPHDTLVTATNLQGDFSARVKPGVYLCRAESEELSSAGIQTAAIGGEHGAPNVTLYVTAVATVRGAVRDALTQQPVAEARITLNVSGAPAGAAETGPDGLYTFRTTEGENTVCLESAPGCALSDNKGVTFYVAGGQTTEAPTFWVRRLPAYTAAFLDGELQPVPGAVATVLRPEQFGWWRASADGRIAFDLAAPPTDGIVVGFAEHPKENLGAAFALRQSELEASGGGRVQLLPFGSVSGRVLDADGGPVEGAIVAAAFAEGPNADPVIVWRTVSRADGRFSWEYAVQGVRMTCLATDSAGATARSMPFVVEAGQEAAAGSLVMTGAKAGHSLFGQPLNWTQFPLVQGDMPAKEEALQTPAVVLFCTGAEAPYVTEAAARIAQFPESPKVRFVVVADGPCKSCAGGVLVLKGERPGPASTYLLAPGGNVASETVGLPPLAALRKLAAPAS